MKITAFATILSLVFASSASAGEVHIISRDAFGSFLSSHQIFLEKRRGYLQVDYCGNSYYVRWLTLNWMQMQVYEQHELGLEYSDGGQWQLICRAPQDQMVMADGDDFLRLRERMPLWESRAGWATRLNK